VLKLPVFAALFTLVVVKVQAVVAYPHAGI